MNNILLGVAIILFNPLTSAFLSGIFGEKIDIVLGIIIPFWGVGVALLHFIH